MPKTSAIRDCFLLSEVGQCILRHPGMVRLRHIHQLGLAPRVFPLVLPGMNRSRFQHSLSVGRLSRWAAYTIAKNSQIEVSDEMLKWAEWSGLLHDVGHGPFSHAFDKNVERHIHRFPRWIASHETRAQHICQWILTEIAEEHPHLDIQLRDIRAVTHMIHPRGCERPNYVPEWLSQLVCNLDHGIDVDRLEYLTHDTRTFQRVAQVDPFIRKNTAASSSSSPSTLSLDQVVGLYERGKIVKQRFQFSQADSPQLENILRMRMHLRSFFYQHPLVQSHELLFQQAFDTLLAMEPHRFQCLEFRSVRHIEDFFALAEHHFFRDPCILPKPIHIHDTIQNDTPPHTLTLRFHETQGTETRIVEPVITRYGLFDLTHLSNVTTSSPLSLL